MIKLSYHRLNGEHISKNIIKPSLDTTKGTNSGMFCYLLNIPRSAKIKNIILPYNNKQSWDAILRENFSQFNIYLTTETLATEERYRYSIRKDLNLEGQKGATLKKMFVKITKFLFP